MLKLTILGCNGLYPANGNNTSGYFIKGESFNLVADMGSGVFSSLKNIIEPEKVSAIFISHLHHDHIADLGVYNYYLENLSKKAKFSGKIKLFVNNDQSAVYQSIAGLNYFEIVNYIEENPALLGNATLTFFKMQHPVLTHGVTVCENGKTISYTADGSYSENLENAIKNSDLTICHAPFSAEQGKNNKAHSTVNEVCAMAKKYNKKIIISHLLPDQNNGKLMQDGREIAGTLCEFAVSLAEYSV